MSAQTRNVWIVGLVLVAVLFFLFGGGLMSHSMMGAGTMGRIGWMFVPTLLVLILGILLGWALFGQK